MMVKPAPVPAFEVSQAKFLLQFFVVALDAPAQFCSGNQFAQSDRGGQIRQPVFGWFFFCLRPFDQQPLLRMRFFAPVITMCHAHTNCCKTRTHPATCSFTPTDLAQVGGAQAQGKVFGREWLMLFISSQQSRSEEHTS